MAYDTYLPALGVLLRPLAPSLCTPRGCVGNNAFTWCKIWGHIEQGSWQKWANPSSVVAIAPEPLGSGPVNALTSASTTGGSGFAQENTPALKLRPMLMQVGAPASAEVCKARGHLLL